MRTCDRMCECGTALRLRYIGFELPPATGAEVQTPPFTADGAVLPSWLR